MLISDPELGIWGVHRVVRDCVRHIFDVVDLGTSIETVTSIPPYTRL